MHTLKLLMAGFLVLGALAEPEPEPYRKLDYGYHEPSYSKPSYTPHSYTPTYTTESSYDAYSKPGYVKFPSALDFKPSGLKSSYDYKPTQYDSYYCDPRAPPKCAQYANATYCLKDYEYPEREIQYAIEYDPLVLKKYADVSDQSADNLVDGVSALEERNFDYTLYQGKTFDKGNWVGGEGYICPSDVLYARPQRAVNVKGEWRVIVQNVSYYTQTQRIEACLFPGSSCRTLAPCYKSKCVQKYVYHRMLSFDPCDSSKGLFIDIYKLPSACSCHIPIKI